ncbi:hypothetical protein [Burkholderia glumae]|uniref:hypothetical protein n=1 Tax=Burkholderia glumae TaxID=337 RepID=UPI003B9985D7
MAFLVFNRSTKFDFYNWLADAQQDVYALTSKPMNRPGKYRMIRKFDDLGAPLADQLALELGRTAPIGFIASQSEYDMLRVAALREALGLPGQSVQSARAYRDKVLMKDHMAAAGISDGALPAPGAGARSARLHRGARLSGRGQAGGRRRLARRARAARGARSA